MWWWRRTEKISWTDRVRNKEVLHRVRENRNTLHTIKWRKANWIGHLLRRNCIPKRVIEGKFEGRIEMMGRRGRRGKQLLDDLKEKRRCRKLKEEAPDRTLWRTRFGRGYGPVVRQTAKRISEWCGPEGLQELHFRCFCRYRTGLQACVGWRGLLLSLDGNFRCIWQPVWVLTNMFIPYSNRHIYVLVCSLFA
jgi:hypothetical protein